MKILITEEQYTLIQEQNTQLIMSIRDLADMIGRHGYDELGIQSLFEVLLDGYRRDGDEGVMDLFKSFTGLKITPIRRGKYIFDYK